MLKRMAIAFLLLFAILVISLYSSGRGFAQGIATTTAVSTATAVPDPSAGSSASLLVLTLRDDGSTFTVPVRGRIVLRIPPLPNTRLQFDPAILRLLSRELDPLEPQPLPNPDGSGPKGTPRPSIYASGDWLLLAIRPGTTSLTLETRPCTNPPCPMMPEYRFSVTIMVRRAAYPLPTPLPPLPPRSTEEKYIGMAFLEQTVRVKVGQIVRLDLPFLPAQQRVRLQFDPAVLQLLPNQSQTYPPPKGWQFSVIGTGTSPLVVQADQCQDRPGEGTACPPMILFRVTITTEP